MSLLLFVRDFSNKNRSERELRQEHFNGINYKYVDYVTTTLGTP